MKYLIIVFFISFSSIIVYSGDCWPWESGIYGYIFAVKENGTGSGYTEVHILDRYNDYQSFRLHAVTPIEETYDNRFCYTITDFCLWGSASPSLFAVKKWETGSGKTEVHILIPPNFNQFADHLVTCMDQVDPSLDNYCFLAGKFGNACDWLHKDDLWVIKKAYTASGNLELTVLNGDNNFTTVKASYILPIITGDPTIGYNDWQFGLGRLNDADPYYNPDNWSYLYIFKVWNPSNPAPQQLEIIVVRSDDPTKILFDMTTPYLIYNQNEIQCSTYMNEPFESARRSNVVIVKKNHTGTGTTEVHVLNRIGDYQKFLLEVPVPIEENYTNFQFNSAFWLIPNPDTSQTSLKANKLKNNDNYSFSLNNYPNPFNPTTIIKYSIPKSGYTQLKIFDQLGREVTTLVNEYKEKGNYSVEFNGNNFASGIYFYTLKSGDLKETKKMLLIK